MWLYNPTFDFTPAEVDVWKECGMTAPMGPAMHYGKDDPRDLIPFLDRAHELGLKLIANFGDLTYNSYRVLGEAEVERRFLEIYEPLKGHPALLGFFAGDEPQGAENIEATEAVYRVHKRLAPELYPYVNLISDTGRTHHYFRDCTVGEWFKRLADMGVTYVSQDFYGPMINEQTTTWFFGEMMAAVEAAENAGVDLWANMLSSAHYAYRVPTAAEILWQITVPAACGCRGVIWFRFYDRAIGHEYYGSPIDEYGYKTQTFYNMMIAQRRFTDQYGELLMGLKRKATFLKGTDRESYPMFEKGCHDLIDVNCYEDAVISFFEDDMGREYLCIVNAYRDMHATIHIGFDRSKCALTELLLNGAHELKIGGAGTDLFDGEFSFYPGQMRMFRIDKK